MPRKLTVRVQQLGALKSYHCRDSINQGASDPVKCCPHLLVESRGWPSESHQGQKHLGVINQAPPRWPRDRTRGPSRSRAPTGPGVLCMAGSFTLETEKFTTGWVLHVLLLNSVHRAGLRGMQR